MENSRRLYEAGSFWLLYNIQEMIRRGLCALLLLLTTLFAIWRTFPTPPLTATAPVGQFSAGRARETLQAIARSPRTVRSPAYESARYYLLNQLAALGMRVETQDVDFEGVWVENTLGRLQGRVSNNAILLVAHLDSVAKTIGAMDNASGVAEVLETVRALKAGQVLPNTLMVLFTGPEENCCYGAKAFVTLHPWARDVRLVINTDAGGVNGPSILAATGPQEGWLIREIAAVLPHPIGSSAIETFGAPATDYTLEFRRDGFMGVDFNLSWTKRIHTPLDDLSHINLASIQHQGEHLLAVAQHFGNRPLDFPREPRPVYFDVLGLTLVHYPAEWAVQLFLVAAFLFVGTLTLAIQLKRLKWKGMAFGGLAFLLSLVTVPPLLLLIQWAVIQPMLRSASEAQLLAELGGESLLSNSLRWGAVLLTLAASGLWVWLFRRFQKTALVDLMAGIYLVLAIAAGVSSVILPSVSYLFIWPLAVGLLALLLQIFLGSKPQEWTKWVTGLGWTLAGAAAILIYVSGILIATLSVEIQMVYLVPVFAAVLCGFMAGPVLMIVGRE